MDTLRYYSDMFDKLIDNNDWWKIWFQRPTGMDTDYYEDECNFYFGATRCGVVPVEDTCEWIVKIDVDEDARNRSLCEQEVRTYDAAKRYGIQDCFCPAKFLGYYEKDILFYDMSDNSSILWDDEEDFEKDMDEIAAEQSLEKIHICVPLYAYRRANCDLNLWGTRASDEERAFVESHRSPLTERNINVALRMISDWGIDVYVELCKFTREYHINDLHGGNIGEIAGRAILTDYAGYQSSDYCEEENSEYGSSSESEY